MLRGFRSLQRREQISVFIRHFSQWKEEEARVRSRVGDTGFPIRGHGIPGRPYRLRQRFAAIHWLDLFLYLSETGFPPGKRRCNAFMIADLIPLKVPHWVIEGAIQAWTRYYDMAREHGDVFLAFTEHVKNDMVETLGIPRDRIEVVPLARAGTSGQSPTAGQSPSNCATGASRSTTMFCRWGRSSPGRTIA